MRYLFLQQLFSIFLLYLSIGGLLPAVYWNYLHLTIETSRIIGILEWNIAQNIQKLQKSAGEICFTRLNFF